MRLLFDGTQNLLQASVEQIGRLTAMIPNGFFKIDEDRFLFWKLQKYASGAGILGMISP